MNKKATEKPRLRKASKYSSFRLEQKIKHPAGPPKTYFGLLNESRILLKKNWKTCLALLLIYLMLTVVFVYGSAPSLERNELLDSLKELVGGDLSKVVVNLTLFFSLLLNGTGEKNEVGQVYQGVMFAIFALCYIWVFRQYYAGKAVSAKQALYRGLYPLVQFVLVLIAMAIQTLPFFAAMFLTTITFENGIAVTIYEKAIFVLLTFSCLVLSLYMMTASVFALFIVTLADMTPMVALKSARDLVQFRRWAIMRRILLLPLTIISLMLLIVLPTLAWTSAIAPWVFLLTLLGALPYTISYMFSLYKSLL